MKMTFEQYDQLKERGLSEEQIQTLAQKKGIKMPSEGIVKSIVRQGLVQPAVRVGQTIGAGVARLAGASPERVSQVMQKDQNVNFPFLGEMRIRGQKPFGEGGGMQIAGEALEQGATYLPYGRVATGISKVVAPIAGRGASTAGFIGAGATGGYGFDVAQGLKEGNVNLTPGLGTVIGGAIPAVPAIAKGAGSAIKYGTAQSTGLNPETITTLLTRPQALTQVQREGLNRTNLASQVNDAFQKRASELSHTGKGYETIRAKNYQIDLHEDIPTKVLNKFGVKVENGRILVGPESTPLTQADKNALENFIIQYGDVKTLTPNGILNVRQAISNLSAFEQGKSGVSKAIATTLRKEYDDIAKRSLPELATLDAKYAPERKMIDEWKKEFFTPNGELKDSAINKIANIVGTGKDKQLARLEELVPGIGQKAQLLKAMEDIAGAGGQKVGTYARAALTGGAFITNPVLGLLSAVATTPAIAAPIIKAVGRTRQWADDAVTRVIGKLTTGKTLTNTELLMFRASMDEHIRRISPGDQFLDTPLGKKTEEYAKNIRPGMSIQSVVDDGMPPTGGMGGQRQGLVGQNTPQTKGLQPRDTSLPDTLPQTTEKATDMSTDLLQEAKKYKSAEEFVESINNKGDNSFIEPTVGLKTKTGEPVIMRAFHGTDKQFDEFKIPKNGVRYTGDGVYFYPSKINANGYVSGKKGGRVVESYLDLKKPYTMRLPEGNIDFQPGSERIREIQNAGYDAIIVRTGKGSDDIINEIVVFDTKAIKTKSQLTDIWNKAQKNK